MQRFQLQIVAVFGGQNQATQTTMSQFDADSSVLL